MCGSTRARTRRPRSASYGSGPTVEVTVLDDGAGRPDGPRPGRRRPRSARHARAGHRTRRHPHRRPPLRRRLPRAGDTAAQDRRTGEDTMTIRVLLADDQALLRSAFRVLVDSEPDMEVVGEAADGAEAVALARSAERRRRPDGHPDARYGRPRRHPHDQRGPGARPCTRRHADHLRGGRVRRAVAAGRGLRLPRQGRGTGRTAQRHPDRRRRARRCCRRSRPRG